jgi:predicted nuclease with TOPRIM domain
VPLPFIFKTLTMSDNDIFHKTVQGIHGQYKEVGDTLKSLSVEQAKINGFLKSIDDHLSRVNGHIRSHSDEIDILKEYRIRQEVECEHEKDRREELQKDKRQMTKIILMLIGSLIISLVVGYFL